MGIFGGKNLKTSFYHLSGIEQYKYKTPVSALLNTDAQRLELKWTSKEAPITLNFSQITACGVVDNLKIQKEGNNVVGNALLGGLILGPLGALVGGMSGLGEKELVINKCFIINYRPISGPDETKAILFQVNPSWPWKKFVSSLQELTNGLPEESRQL